MDEQIATIKESKKVPGVYNCRNADKKLVAVFGTIEALLRANLLTTGRPLTAWVLIYGEDGNSKVFNSKGDCFKHLGFDEI